MTGNGNNANLLKTCFENIREIAASELIFWRAYSYYIYCLERFNKKINDIHFLFLIMTFLRRWWQLPYFWAGIKVYDIVSGDKCLKSSFIMSKERALEMFPMLKRDKLKGK